MLYHYVARAQLLSLTIMDHDTQVRRLDVGMIVFMGLIGVAMLGMALLPDFQKDEDEEAVSFPEEGGSSTAKGSNILQELSEVDELSTDEDLGSRLVLSKLHGVFGDNDENALLGSSADDYISGKGGEDLIQGGGGDDVLDGVHGELIASSDLIRGGSGDDFLIGGSLDKMSGGTGEDCFAIDASTHGDEAAIVEDFDLQSDEILIGYQMGDQAPNLELEETDVGTSILIDGEVLLVLEGIKGLSSDAITLVQIDGLNRAGFAAGSNS